MKNNMQFLCNECEVLFTMNKNRLRHVRTVYQGMKRSDNEKTKATNEKRKREVQAEKIMLSNTDIKDVIMKSNPTEAICFHFVRNTPWTEDMKIKQKKVLKKLSEPVTRLLCLCSTNQEKKM